MQRITIRTARGQRHRSQQLAKGNYPLADAAMAATLGRLGCNATVHGMRSAFSALLSHWKFCRPPA
jgi:hypothetical protein